MPKIGKELTCACGCGVTFKSTGNRAKFAEECTGPDAPERAKKRAWNSAYHARKKKEGAAKPSKPRKPRKPKTSNEAAEIIERANVESARELRAIRGEKLKSAFEQMVTAQAQFLIMHFEEVVDEKYVIESSASLEQVSRLFQARTEALKTGVAEAQLFSAMPG